MTVFLLSVTRYNFSAATPADLDRGLIYGGQIPPITVYIAVVSQESLGEF